MMMHANYIRLMYVRFKDGEVLYHRPFEFKLLDNAWDDVLDYYSVYVPEDGYEVRKYC